MRDGPRGSRSERAGIAGPTPASGGAAPSGAVPSIASGGDPIPSPASALRAPPAASGARCVDARAPPAGPRGALRGGAPPRHPIPPAPNSASGFFEKSRPPRSRAPASASRAANSPGGSRIAASSRPGIAGAARVAGARRVESHPSGRVGGGGRACRRPRLRGFGRPRSRLSRGPGFSDACRHPGGRSRSPPASRGPFEIPAIFPALAVTVSHARADPISARSRGVALYAFVRRAGPRRSALVRAPAGRGRESAPADPGPRRAGGDAAGAGPPFLHPRAGGGRSRAGGGRSRARNPARGRQPPPRGRAARKTRAARLNSEPAPRRP